MKALAIIPTYNEANNVSEIISLVLSQSDIIDILIIDDNSPDSTSKIVEEIMKTNSRVKLKKRSGKMGLGSAYVYGFKFALKNNYDYIFEIDADLSHNPADMKTMLEEIKYYDLVIGSRYCSGINVINWPMKRLLLSYFACLYVRIITGMPIKDPTSGFKCFRRETLECIDLNSVLSDGYLFQIEINYRVWLAKKRIKEIPIIFTERASGESKMSKDIIYEAVWKIWKLKFLAMIKKLV